MFACSKTKLGMIQPSGTEQPRGFCRMVGQSNIMAGAGVSPSSKYEALDHLQQIVSLA